MASYLIQIKFLPITQTVKLLILIIGRFLLNMAICSHCYLFHMFTALRVNSFCYIWVGWVLGSLFPLFEREREK
jgi:hypothetical protein